MVLGKLVVSCALTALLQDLLQLLRLFRSNTSKEYLVRPLRKYCICSSILPTTIDSFDSISQLSNGCGDHTTLNSQTCHWPASHTRRAGERRINFPRIYIFAQSFQQAVDCQSKGMLKLSLRLPPRFLLLRFVSASSLRSYSITTRRNMEVPTARSRSVSPTQQPHKKPRLDEAEKSGDVGGAETEGLAPDAPAEAMAVEPGSAVKSSKPRGKRGGKKDRRKVKHKLPDPYTSEDVVHRDVIALLGQDVVDRLIEEGKDWTTPFQMREEVELTVSALSSNGE